MELNQAFGIILKEQRKRLGLTQEVLALKSQVDRNFISLLEQGKNSPSLRIQLKLTSALGIPPTEFLCRVLSSCTETWIAQPHPSHDQTCCCQKCGKSSRQDESIRVLQSDNESLQQRLFLMENSLGLVRDGIWHWDVERGELWFSDRWKHMLGYEPGEIQATFRNWQNLIHPDDLGAFLIAWLSYLDGCQEDFFVPYRLKHKEGNWVWVECRGRMVQGDAQHPRHIVGVHTDISGWKRYEETLQEYHQRLEHEVQTRTQKLESEIRKLGDQAQHDHLTGLLNRAALDEVGRMEMEHTLSQGVTFSILMIDVDHFKQYNDHFGHLVGDDCLRKIAAALMNASRRGTDSVFRYGGEEFLAFLPGTNATGARQMAETLRQTVENLCIESPLGNPVTISIGVATPKRGLLETLETLIKRADQALYRAKRKGRNRVEAERAK